MAQVVIPAGVTDGVGIGFGLQNIFSNFISGLIVMFERPVKIGDRIVVGGFEGDVLSIQASTTTLRTNRSAIVIVLNRKFIAEFVRNWDAGLHGGNTTSMTLPVKVTHDADPEAAQHGAHMQPLPSVRGPSGA